MRTVKISDGVTLTGTNKTINKFFAERDSEQKRIRDDEFFYNQLEECRKMAEKTGDWDLYSDLYKDYYGVRPRW